MLISPAVKLILSVCNILKKVIFGHHAVNSALNSEITEVSEIFYLATHTGNISPILKLATEKKITLRPVERAHLDKLSQGENHQGVIAMAERTRSWDESDFLVLVEKFKESKSSIILVLDGVQDPHNLGACLRSADAFGAKMVIIPKDKSCQITPVVEKVACGAAQNIPVIPVTNLARVLKELKDHDYWIMGFAGEAEQSLEKIKAKDLQGSIALVMGGEGEGLRRLTKERCDYLVKIPMVGSVESLNVSVATGVALYAVFAAQSLN